MTGNRKSSQRKTAQTAAAVAPAAGTAEAAVVAVAVAAAVIAADAASFAFATAAGEPVFADVVEVCPALTAGFVDRWRHCCTSADLDCSSWIVRLYYYSKPTGQLKYFCIRCPPMPGCHWKPPEAPSAPALSSYFEHWPNPRLQ